MYWELGKKKNTLFLEMTKKLLPLHFFIRGMDGKGEWIAMGYKELTYILKYAEVSPDVDRYLDSYLN